MRQMISERHLGFRVRIQYVGTQNDSMIEGRIIQINDGGTFSFVSGDWERLYIETFTARLWRVIGIAK
jgi:hypothetical protein